MLTKPQRQAARALFEGHSAAETARQMGIPYRRVLKWLRREEFQQELDRLGEEMMYETRSILTRYGPLAAAKLVTLLESQKEDTARRTALDLIDRCLNRKTTAPDEGSEEETDLSDEQAQQMLKTLAEGFKK